jgi:DNA (cytosine-5)-methyltransferase 1
MENIEVIQVGNIVNDADINFKNPQRGRIYSQEGLSLCLCDGSGGGGREPKIVEGIKIKEATKQGYAEAEEGDSINLSNPHSTTRRGRVGKQIANTLDTGCQQGVVAKYRIRKLTPRECFRLMGVDDADIDKIQASGISNSQQYKLAGNSIVVDNLYHIFRKMFVEIYAEPDQQLTLF